jgi:hypothetical protein
MSRYALRLAGRELRGGIRGLRVFVACLILGVSAIAGIGSLAASVAAGIAGNARELLGGDAEARLPYRAANAAERAFLEGSGRISEIASLRAMARSRRRARQTLISLKAVDAAYPLYGKVGLMPVQSPSRAFVVLAAGPPACDPERGRQAEFVDDLLQLGRERSGAAGIEFSFEANFCGQTAGRTHLWEQSRAQPVPLLGRYGPAHADNGGEI